MFIRTTRSTAVALLLTGLLGIPNAARGTDLQITVTSQAPGGGFAFSPVWFGIHDGSFDTFNPGSAASASVEAIAELADTSPVTAAFSGMGPQTTLASPGGPFAPGAAAATTITVSTPATNRYLSYLAMVVPSNDMFIGNGNPLAIELFDGSGNFLGPQTINIFGANVWDAGTEVNDANDGIAFIIGQSAPAGTTENGTIGLFLDRPDAASYLNSILGATTPAGYDISELLSAQGLIATIQIQEVPEPGTVVLAGLGAIALLAVNRGRQGRRVTV